MSTDSDDSHGDGGNEEFERLVQAVKHELKNDDEFGGDRNVMTRRASLGALLGLGGGFGLAGMTGNAEAAGESWGSASGTVGTDASPLAGLNVSDGDLQSLQMVDTAQSPSEAGEFRQNAGDVEVYTGGGVKNLTNIGSGGGGTSFPVSQDLQIERSQSLSGGTQIENMSFSAQGLWRDTLPNEEYSNVLPIHQTGFFADQFVSDSSAFTQYQLAGSSTVTRTIDKGELTFDNSTGALQEEWFSPHTSPDTPFFASMLRVESYSESWNSGGGDSNPGIGLINTTNDWLTISIDPAAGEVVVYENWGGSGSSLLASTTEPTLPADLLSIFVGNKVHVLTRPVETSEGWTYHGNASWSASSKDLFDNTQRGNLDLTFTHRLADTESVTISEFRSFMTPMFGIRDPSPVTYRDGAPFMRGDWMYFAGSCAGGVGIGDSYQGIFRYNTETEHVEFTGAIFDEPGNGSTYNDYAGHVMYDEDADEFVVSLSGWGQRETGNISQCDVFLGRTSDDVLHGINKVGVSNANLPDPNADDVYDPYIIYDSAAGAYRNSYNSGHYGIVVSETTDDSLTTSWSQLHNRTISTSSTIEGSKICRVDGEYVLTYADATASPPAVSSDYPDPSTNVQSLSFDVVPGYSKPHVPVIPIFKNGTTEYLAFSFDGAGYQGKGDYTHGNLMIYRADQTASGYEFPTRSVYR